ncbi:MAG: GTPase Era [Bacteroidetes bacterium]|nr:GTPase Era [Bacteroidota bacterium]
MSKPPAHRSGFVNIVGNPNVGKSTLMNGLVGEKLSIVTAKAQTTRHRIMGIVNGPDYQIVYSDTPGILKPNYKLQERMMDFVDIAMGDADIMLYVTDVVETGAKNEDYLEKIRRINIPVLLVINKIDLTNQQALESLVEQWQNLLPKAEIFPVSALEKFNLDHLFDRIVALLPPSPPWYDKAVFTDRNLRFFASEIIREKILLHYAQEIPYCTEVVIEEFKEDTDMYRIRAVIHVMRESQKGIVIGAKGNMLKKVGTQARIDMESFFERKVFLELFVKVNPNWREDKRKLKQFGYIEG